MNRAPVYSLLAFSVLCMATSSIIIRFSSASPMVIAFYRVTFTALLAAVLGNFAMIRELKNIQKKDYLFIGGAGIFLALHFSFWITSLGYTSISSSVLFTNLQVIFVLIFSILFLHEKINAWIGGGIFTALIGCTLIAKGDLVNGKLLGDMLALASGLFVAIYFIIGRQVRSRVGTWTYTSLVSLTAAIILLLASILMGLNLTEYPSRDWLLFFLLALGPGIAGHGILNWALKYVKAPVVAISILGESVGASIMAWLIFNEYLQWYQIIGGILILCGIYLAAANENKITSENNKLVV
ncbi:Drug/metabolite transporter [Syntrophomonas zehnderi OL-4]|uniref:Drug/metabolite transporter n=1 Tax=Syntrophomonas zehnderi OL-4 TaxID=690567 RepID=A0A0E4GED1_9FIRM|nr:DMT family transporter [Syntrophomonas zehnderi]CFX84719.1 Drug/metabolite transporter [Syntrophomonas zehnderi OL-4]